MILCVRMTSTALYEAYLAVVFTRNPDLHLPAQRSALLMVAFVRSVEQLMVRD